MGNWAEPAGTGWNLLCPSQGSPGHISPMHNEKPQKNYLLFTAKNIKLLFVQSVTPRVWRKCLLSVLFKAGGKGKKISSGLKKKLDNTSNGS